MYGQDLCDHVVVYQYVRTMIMYTRNLTDSWVLIRITFLIVTASSDCRV